MTVLKTNDSNWRKLCKHQIKSEQINIEEVLQIELNIGGVNVARTRNKDKN